MVKKYKQTRKDRKYESYGMDSGYMGMISEDKSAVANLPQYVVQKEYSKELYQDKYELDDTIEGVDENIREGVRKLEEYPSKSMY